MTAPFPVPPRPRAGQQRAYWRAPASASALALGLAGLARAHWQDMADRIDAILDPPRGR